MVEIGCLELRGISGKRTVENRRKKRGAIINEGVPGPPKHSGIITMNRVKMCIEALSAELVLGLQGSITR